MADPRVTTTGDERVTTFITVSVALQANAASLDGAGTVAREATGALQADTATVSGSGEIEGAGVVEGAATVDAAGALVAQPTALVATGEAYSTLTGTEAAFASINQPGGILMAVDVDPHQHFAKWGLERLNKGHDI